MATIGGKVAVNLIDDGAQLHTCLVSDKPLYQAWAGGAGSVGAVDPDWSNPLYSPTVHLDAREGSTPVEIADAVWSYNNVEIVFNDATQIDTNFGGVFQRTTYNITYDGHTYTMPALKIIGNLTSSNVIQEKLLSLSGHAMISGAPVEYTSSIGVHLGTTTASGGFSAYLAPTANNGAIIYEPGQTVVFACVLKQFTEGSGFSAVNTSAYRVKWRINDGQYEANPSTKVIYDGNEYWKIELTENMITDYGIVEVEFYEYDASAQGGYGELITSAFNEVDDKQDVEMMYIASKVSLVSDANLTPADVGGAAVSETGEGNENNVRKGQKVSYVVWIAEQANAQAHHNYPYYYIKLTDNLQNVITDPIHNWGVITPKTEYANYAGYRRIPNATDASNNSYWGAWNYSFAELKSLTKRLSGRVIATTFQLEED